MLLNLGDLQEIFVIWLSVTIDHIFFIWQKGFNDWMSSTGHAIKVKFYQTWYLCSVLPDMLFMFSSTRHAIYV